DDIHALGEAISIAYTHKVPSLELLDASSNYCIWQIIVSTAESINEIKDVFIFVEDECELHIDLIAESAIVNQPDVKTLVDKALGSNILLATEDFKQGQWMKPDHPVFQEEKKKIAIKEHKIASMRVSSHKIDE